MALVQFYHLTATPLERALPKLLEKAYGAGHRLVLVAGSAEKADYFNGLLWTYDPGSFLPHGSAADGEPAAHPIFISPDLQTPNGARIAVITDGSAVKNPDAFERVIDLFDGRDEEAVTAARARWANYKAAGCSLAYLQQSPQGGWQEKVAA